jgi:hypothetical protein
VMELSRISKAEAVLFANFVDPRETPGKAFKRKNNELWEITKTQYLLDGLPAAPRHFGEVDISDETDVVSYEDLEFGFCPRGYFVSANGLPETWCPVANIVIAYLKNKNNPIVDTYDSRIT